MPLYVLKPWKIITVLSVCFVFFGLNSQPAVPLSKNKTARSGVKSAEEKKKKKKHAHQLHKLNKIQWKRALLSLCVSISELTGSEEGDTVLIAKTSIPFTSKLQLSDGANSLNAFPPAMLSVRLPPPLTSRQRILPSLPLSLPLSRSLGFSESLRLRWFPGRQTAQSLSSFHSPLW